MVNLKLTKHLKVTQTQDRLIVTYIIFAIVLICLVFTPQLGYIHPDEFFQSVEVMAGDEFGLEHTRTWEFNSTFPVRSVAIPWCLFRLPMNLFGIILMYLNFHFGIDLRTSYALLVFPRFIMCVLSFLNDWSLYKFCKSYGLKHEVRLLALGSSYVMLIFGTRTFSNTIEMTLCTLLLYIVGDCMVHSNTVIFQAEYLKEKLKSAETAVDKVKYLRLQKSLPKHSLNKCILLAAICVTGCFNRPTFIIFGMPIIFFWFVRGLGSNSISIIDFKIRFICFIGCSIPFILFFLIFDSVYFGYFTSHDFYHLNIEMENFVLTPLNFIRYNINPANTAQHGIHPKYLHLVVNIPLLYNVLGIISLFSVGGILWKFCRAEFKNLPRSQSAVTLLNSAIFVPVFVLSLINHQEPRFLIPITIPLIILHARKLQSGFVSSNPFRTENFLTTFLYEKILSKKVSAGRVLRFWYVVNMVLTIFFGYIHPGGVIPLTRHLSNSPAYPDLYHNANNVDTHLVTSHIYNIPLSLLFLPNKKTLLINPETGQKFTRKRQFFLYEYGSIDLKLLLRKIKLILDVGEMKLSKLKQRYKLFLAIPSSLTNDLVEALSQSNKLFVQHLNAYNISFCHVLHEISDIIHI